MKRFLEHSEDFSFLAFDDWGRDSTNNNLISEAGLSRLLGRMQSDDDFAIISAYRALYTKNQNIARNRSLRGELNRHGMGPYQLVGHWRECQDPTIKYEDCPENLLYDVTERSYLVVKPKNMTREEFQDFVLSMLVKFEQDGAVYRSGNDVVILSKEGTVVKKLGTKPSVGQIAQGYSQHVKKLNVPFTFEGVEVPSTNIGRRMFQEAGLRYPILEPNKLREAITWDQISCKE